MTAEWAGVYITVVGGVGTVANVWITKSINGKITELKCWILENFIHKDEIENIRQVTQLAQSERRLRQQR